MLHEELPYKHKGFHMGLRPLQSALLTEIAKRLNTICAQVIPFLSQEHQQQVAQAVERAKQVTMAELNAIIGPVQCIF
ncbi:UNVERIFIED_CONTAM: Transducin-like enhancer protein 1 [Gekko kuhli]